MVGSLPSRVNMLLAACERDLGNPDLWFKPDGYPESLALCIIDSIYSTGARYSSVLNVAKRYREYRLDQGGNPDTDGADKTNVASPYVFDTPDHVNVGVALPTVTIIVTVPPETKFVVLLGVNVPVIVTVPALRKSSCEPSTVTTAVSLEV